MSTQQSRQVSQDCLKHWKGKSKKPYKVEYWCDYFQRINYKPEKYPAIWMTKGWYKSKQSALQAINSKSQKGYKRRTMRLIEPDGKITVFKPEDTVYSALARFNLIPSNSRQLKP